MPKVDTEGFGSEGEGRTSRIGVNFWSRDRIGAAPGLPKRLLSVLNP